MQITILALGSRGDVQPFVALGVALEQRGYRVRVAAATDYQALIEDAGLAFAPVVGRIRDVMDFDLVYQALDVANQALPLGFARRFMEHITPLVQRIVTDCLAASHGADALVVSSLGVYPGASIAERLGVPLIPAHMHPFSATRLYPDVSFTALPAWLPSGTSALYNVLTHALSAHGLWQLLRQALNRARQDILRLPPLSPWALWQRVCVAPPLTLYGYSARVAPRPADWNERQQITGYWFLERVAAWQPPAALAAFLAAGPPPVYVGFGSLLAGRDPDAVTASIVAALDRSGQRGILFRGWGDLGNIDLPAHMYATEAVPHDWLFPRVAAVVTHGGAGTTAAALLAGVPPVVVPFFGDQRFWAMQIARLGVGPTPLPRAALTSARLAQAITAATNDPAMAERARLLGQAIAAENGAQHTAQLLARVLGS